MAQDVHVAVFGNVKMLRAVCPQCETYSLILDDELLCCGMSVKDLKAWRYQRMIESEFTRRLPAPSVRKRLLAEQRNCCYYCGNEFGTIVKQKDGKLRPLRVQWDHMVPWIWSANNSVDNYVAACNFCNGYKGAIMFDTAEQAREYLALKWVAKRLEIVEAAAAA